MRILSLLSLLFILTGCSFNTVDGLTAKEWKEKYEITANELTEERKNNELAEIETQKQKEIAIIQAQLEANFRRDCSNEYDILNQKAEAVANSRCDDLDCANQVIAGYGLGMPKSEWIDSCVEMKI